ncbi:MAG TPA: ribosomal protein S18-alanine N-acetyltransferase [Streptosporangiaceae bacterium]|nr:ribosomal protein S18-alanine N-acetyltransferase [Streptosporangiaceae bacterium]
MIVREMTEADLPDVLALERTLFPEDAWSEGMFRDELKQRPQTRYYVLAEEGEGRGELIGYAGLAAAGGAGDVQTIAVRRGHWGRGVGATLLNTLLAEAAIRGCTEVFLEVRADNERAKKLYRRFGFEEVGLRERYYQPSGVDAIVMCRPAGPADAVWEARGG